MDGCHPPLSLSINVKSIPPKVEIGVESNPSSSCIEAHRESEDGRRRIEATLVALESGMAHLTHALKIEIQA